MLLVSGALLVATLKVMSLVKDLLLLALVVHLEDLLLPLGIGLGNPNANIGDLVGIVGGDSLSNGLYKNAAVGLIGELIGQLGFSLQLLEVEVGWVVSHFEVTHPLFMDQFDCWVLELLAEVSHERIPLRESVSGSCVIVGNFFFGCVHFWLPWHVPVLVSFVHPPVLGLSFQMGGREDDHERGVVLVVLLKDFKVRGAVSKEVFDVIMPPFEWFRGFHQDGFDARHDWWVVLIPGSGGAVQGWSTISWWSWDQEHVLSWSWSWWSPPV